jgi:hypothetical protein
MDGQQNRYELFHFYLKCFVSFDGMVNFLGEEKIGRYKTNVLDLYWLKQRAHTQDGMCPHIETRLCICPMLKS